MGATSSTPGQHDPVGVAPPKQVVNTEQVYRQMASVAYERYGGFPSPASSLLYPRKIHTTPKDCDVYDEALLSAPILSVFRISETY